MPSSGVSFSADALYFPEPHDRNIENTITVRNTDKANIVFGVKGTTPARYIVKPRYGVVQPGGTAEVTITLRSAARFIKAHAQSTHETLSEPQNLDDKFQIDCRTVDPSQESTLARMLVDGDDQSILKGLFNDAGKERIVRVSQFVCHYYNITTTKHRVGSGSNVTIIPEGAQVIVREKDRDPERVTSQTNFSSSANFGAQDAPPTPRGSAIRDSSAKQDKKSSQGASSALPQLSSSIEAKRGQLIKLDEELQLIEKQLGEARTENQRLVKESTHAASLINETTALKRRTSDSPEPVKLPFWLIVLFTLVTFAASLMLKVRYFTVPNYMPAE